MDNEQNKEQNTKTAITKKKSHSTKKIIKLYKRKSVGESLVCHQKIAYF